MTPRRPIRRQIPKWRIPPLPRREASWVAVVAAAIVGSAATYVMLLVIKASL